MENFRKTLLIAAVFCAKAAGAYETSLAGIPLEQKYEKLRETLTQKYGKPVSTLSGGDIHGDAFQLNDSAKIHIRTLKDGKLANWIRISGTRPLKNLDFLSLVNLGLDAKTLERLLGKPHFRENQTDGAESHHYKNANFTVETKNGLVSSITIFSDGTALPADPVRSACSVRVPVIKLKDHYWVSAYLMGPSKKPLPASLALDLTSPDVSLSDDLAASLGYELVNEMTTPGVVFLGPVSIITDGFRKDAKGVLGRSVLLAKPMILNFKYSYICFPKSSLDETAKSLSMLSVPAKFDPSGIRLEMKINDEVVPKMRLDPFKETTSIYPRELERLKLRRTIVDKKALLVMLDSTAITVGWNKPSFQLQALSEAPSEQVQAIGADILGGTWIGLDSARNRVYLGF